MAYFEPTQRSSVHQAIFKLSPALAPSVSNIKHACQLKIPLVEKISPHKPHPPALETTNQLLINTLIRVNFSIFEDGTEGFTLAYISSALAHQKGRAVRQRSDPVWLEAEQAVLAMARKFEQVLCRETRISGRIFFAVRCACVYVYMCLYSVTYNHAAWHYHTYLSLNATIMDLFYGGLVVLMCV